jgi:predicted FMN-binding regulatory protein PaiB
LVTINFLAIEANLVGSIEIAQTEKEIQNRVIKLTREKQHLMLEEAGIQLAPTDEDVKQYLHEVLVEVERTKMKSHH